MLRKSCLALLFGAGLALTVAAQAPAPRTPPPPQGPRPVVQFGQSIIDLDANSGYLGVYLEEVTPERMKELGLSQERGAIVMSVVKGSPAEKAGLGKARSP